MRKGDPPFPMIPSEKRKIERERKTGSFSGPELTALLFSRSRGFAARLSTMPRHSARRHDFLHPPAYLLIKSRREFRDYFRAPRKDKINAKKLTFFFLFLFFFVAPAPLRVALRSPPLAPHAHFSASPFCTRTHSRTHANTTRVPCVTSLASRVLVEGFRAKLFSISSMAPRGTRLARVFRLFRATGS
ncbi:hypothetical protein PUN28_012218 [Cardiocondyla obscurior]|uniref:Transmembrane protein n=1 Tax=Cardiocondyla obscurior TaxID=286306 RepID=A0AAW2FA56_9HYME